MAFFKKRRQKINGKWYPEAVIAGHPVSTDQAADRLSAMSTVSRADTYAVLKDLAGVPADYMAEGRPVRLEGLGTFRYTTVSAGKGVDTPDKVSASQITGVRVRFTPEVGRNSAGKVVIRPPVSNGIFRVELGAEAVPATPDTQPAEPPSGGGGDFTETPENHPRLYFSRIFSCSPAASACRTASSVCSATFFICSATSSACSATDGACSATSSICSATDGGCRPAERAFIAY
jgi:predicted histone-like DNA-binding protein